MVPPISVIPRAAAVRDRKVWIGPSPSGFGDVEPVALGAAHEGEVLRQHGESRALSAASVEQPARGREVVGDDVARTHLDRGDLHASTTSYWSTPYSGFGLQADGLADLRLRARRAPALPRRAGGRRRPGARAPSAPGSGTAGSVARSRGTSRNTRFRASCTKPRPSQFGQVPHSMCSRLSRVRLRVISTRPSGETLAMCVCARSRRQRLLQRREHLRGGAPRPACR